ncbi:MAG: magnesium/cobalt transporter CorA [Chloroflexota bacterium]|nr:MAG: magnesium/cobalt transporter CorA [Chloroflexota bacterium]
MIHSIYFSSNNSLQTNLETKAFPPALNDPQGVIWVDFEGEDNDITEPILRDVFHFHQLAIEDALTESHIPRIDDWESYIYVVLHGITFGETEDGTIDTVEVDVFLGENYIVTHHDKAIPALTRVWGNLQRDERHLKMGADHILYRLSDELVVDYMSVVEGMDEEIDMIEDRVFHQPSSRLLSRIFTLKRATLQLRRTISPLREVMNKLARDDYQMIDQKDRVYFRDIYDHLVRLHDISESLRDLVGGTLDTYLSVINNRMNDIMKTLTVITTLFMPLSFLVGFFGMNFFVPDPNVPLSDWVTPPMFVATLLIMLLTPVVMFTWMHRRGWM